MERSHRYRFTPGPPWMLSSDEKMLDVRTLVRILSPAVIILITTSLLRHSPDTGVGPRPHKAIQTKELLLLLTELALIPPEAPVNQTCRPPELREDKFFQFLSEKKYLPFREPTCGSETGFTGRRRNKRASVILMMLFSFEVDTLEISLRESHDVVDHIFIVESSRTHRGVIWKKSKKI